VSYSAAGVRQDSGLAEWWRTKMKHSNPAMFIVVGALMLLGFLLSEHGLTSAQFQSTVASPVLLPALDRITHHPAPTTTATATPVHLVQSVEAFIHPAQILANTRWDDLSKLDQPLWAQSSAPQADCTGVANGTCVETRAGLSLCNLNNICVIKVDLNRNTLQPRVVIAPSGGTAWLSSMATTVGGIAAINGDYFSGCPDTSPPLNCGEGLTFVEGTDFTDYSGSEWQNRRSLGINGSYDPNIGWPNEQNDFHWLTLGGGPQVTFGGEYRWRCWYQGYNTDGDCTCSNNTVVINDELFGCSANNWWNRPQSFVGFSDDRNTLYLAASRPGYNKTPHEMHDVLWVHGARNTLKLDGGGSSGLYFNDGGYSFAWNGSREVASAWVIVPYTVPPSPTPPPAGSWHVEYFSDRNLGGRCYDGYESTTYMVKQWGSGSPASGCPNDSFSARFTRTMNFSGGDYRFHCQHDDGCRIFIDGQLRLDAWWDSSFTGHDWGGVLSSGNHEVKIEYYENSGDARLEAWWQGAGYLPTEQGCSAGEWCAEYWGNVDLQGAAFMRLNEGGGVLDHNWGAGGPGTPYGLPGDRFSDRFQRTVGFACGRYRFNVFSDDGVRLWVGNQLLLDQWHPQAASFQVEADLQAGNAVVRVEHYEEAGGAGIHLDWQQMSSCATPTPTITPTPTPLPTFTPTATPTATVCPDYTPPPGIGVEDIQTIVAHWGETPSSLGWEPRFDLNADGRVDIIDVMRTGAAWGTMC